MFIQLNHKSLDIYKAIRNLTTEVYKISNQLPQHERFNMVQQIRRAVLSVKLNFSEGATRRSAAERKRFIEIARGSLVEVDSVLETSVDLCYFKQNDLESIGVLLNRCFAMLSKMITKE